MTAAAGALAVIWSAGLGLALGLIVRAARERRAGRRRIHVVGEAHPPVQIPVQHGPLAEAGIERQTKRLAAELDDPDAVARWLGGTR